MAEIPTKDELIAEMRHEWLLLETLLTSLSEEQSTTPDVEGPWSASDDCMIEPIRKALPEIAFLEEHRRAPIRKAELWDEAELYGAIALFDD